MITISFNPTRSDSSLFFFRRGNDIAYLLLYVDDMVLTDSTPGLLQHIVQRLRAEFAVKDLGELSFFLGIAVKRDAHGFYLSQQRYDAEDILERAGMSSCKSATTPIDVKGKLSADGDKIDDAATY